MSQNFTLDSLSPDPKSSNIDTFIEIYHEILKHEICLMRLGTPCVYNKGFYVSASKSSVNYNVDRKLTIIDILYLVLSTLKRMNINYRFTSNDFRSFFNKLIRSRLLIDLPCDPTDMNSVKKAINNSSVHNEEKEGDLRAYLYTYMNELKGRDDYNEIRKFLEEEIKNNNSLCYKSAFGELIRLTRYETSLPYSKKTMTQEMPYKVLESYILPFIEDYFLDRDMKYMEELCKHLEQKFSDLKEIFCESLRKNQITALNPYQEKMIMDLLQNIDKPKIALISAPTGAGKTLIFMSYIILKLLKEGGVGVIIYPTKALARQQLEDMLNLIYWVNSQLSSGKKICVKIMDGDSPLSKNEVNGDSPFRGGIKINGGELRYTQNKDVELISKNRLEILDWVSEIRSDPINTPCIIITNHSMLSYHLSKNPNWINTLLDNLKLIVIDEAHVFLTDISKINNLHFLLARLLLLSFWNKYGNNYQNLYEDLKKFINYRKIDIILSSATIGDRVLVPNNVSLSYVGGINVSGLSKRAQPDLTPLLRWIQDLYYTIANIGVIYEDYYNFVDKNSKKRLIITTVNFPAPGGGSQTPLIEALATTLIWIEGLSLGVKNAYNLNNFYLHNITFIDNIPTQGEIFRRFVENGIRKEHFHADKLLVSPLITSWQKRIGSEIIKDLLNQIPNGYSLLQDTYLAQYSHIQLFYPLSEINKYIIAFNNNSSNALNIVKDVLVFANNVINSNSIYYVLLHNAKLDPQTRNKIENIIRNNSDKWRLILSTSTLELGLNIPGVSLVYQYGAPTSSESYIQRIGRAGRTNSTLRIAFGSLFMRNVGIDISFIDEEFAFRYLFNVYQQRIPKDIDENTIKRYCALIYIDFNNRKINQQAIKNFLSNVILLYTSEKTPNPSRNIIDEVINLVKARDHIEQIIQKYTNTYNGIQEVYDVIYNVEPMLFYVENILKNMNVNYLKLLLNGNQSNSSCSSININNLVNAPQIINSFIFDIDSITNYPTRSGSISLSILLSAKIPSYIIDLEKIRFDINNVIKCVRNVAGNNQTSLYIHLKNIIKNNSPTSVIYIDNYISDIISQLMRLYAIRLPKLKQSSKVYRILLSSAIDLVTGNVIPNPTLAEIQAIEYVCDDINSVKKSSRKKQSNIIKLKCGNINRKSRDDVIKYIPFRHEE
ncbi:hypothetical protein SJAV_09320 [Sulfurisphaera javensis]|uniref:DEAD/DEAH box helicase n=1 Tax=Sulfurisphaera javensis TaxID=2049879 RepID=A0AAT9GQ05_9CREN